MTLIAAVSLLCVHLGASALSLGRLTVQSTLGESLRAEIDISSMTPEEAATLRATLASPEAFRAAGVDFNAALAGAQATLVRRPDGRQVIRLAGERAVGEPFLDVVLDFSWSGGRLQRAYTLLIDPPARAAAPSQPQPPAVTTAPALAPAPVSPPPPPVAAAPVAPPPPPVRAPAARPAPPPPAASRPPVAAPAASASVAGEPYRVRRGDTLSAIAAARNPGGVSLDQMLVSLYRGNPQAFSGNNMNRLKAGVVLNLPDAETAQAISAGEARQVIQAHSADFAEFRRQLAGAAPAVGSSEPPRQAKGKVEAAVEDRKTGGTPPTPDKLTLSRGALAASAPEAKISKETERKAADARMAELARNVGELQSLKPLAASAASAVSAAPAKAAAVASSASAALNLPVAAPAVPASAAVAASAAASVAEPASAVVAASAPASAAVAASAPKRAPSAPAPVAEEPAPSFLDSLSASPYVLPLAVGLVALLAGLGVMRVRRRSQGAGGETSFLESKLQPDSFFGVSGGQRVDTRDAGNSAASSSLSYSLSQLDAIGDVDPVAEADVYLAYGRDLQAEEILKEALRTDPGRAAIRTKLLEVYAKRADLPAFESQARQLLDVVGEDGDDWVKAQAMGRQLDPGNPLYGGPAEVDLDTSSDPPADLRDAPPAPARAESLDIDKTLPLDEPAATVEGGALDLDIDLDSPASLTGLEPTLPADATLMLGDADEPRAAAAPAPAADELPKLDDDGLPRQDPPVSGPVDFDFGDLSLELDGDKPAEPEAAAVVDNGPDTGAGDEPGDDDPLARKLELADEFRRIGDTEGARDLLEEVIAQADGVLRTRAQAMLDGLG